MLEVRSIFMTDVQKLLGFRRYMAEGIDCPCPVGPAWTFLLKIKTVIQKNFCFIVVYRLGRKKEFRHLLSHKKSAGTDALPAFPADRENEICCGRVELPYRSVRFRKVGPRGFPLYR